MKTQKEKAMDNLICIVIYKERMTSLKNDLIRFINNPDGKPTVKLSTGETALDFDDAWLIIDRKNSPLTLFGCPFLRSKRKQHVFDEDPEKKDSDYIPDGDKIVTWEIERLIDAGETIAKLIDRYLEDPGKAPDVKLTKYVQLDFAEAQFFMEGVKYPSTLFFDPEKNVWFVSEEDYNKTKCQTPWKE